MRHGIRVRLVIEVIGTVAAAAALLLNLVRPAWIEGLTGFEPDGGNGSLELLITAFLALATLFLGAVTRREWRSRPRPPVVSQPPAG